jgi:hypothetical protein
MAPQRRKTPFKDGHQLPYGLLIASRDPETSAVTSALCQFCRVFCREDKVGQKRKPSTSTKAFTSPFRTELDTQHLQGQHPAKWAGYEAASDSEKASFFTGVTPLVTTLHAHFTGSGDQLCVNVDIHIVDIILRKILFDPEDEEVSAERALSMLVPMPDGSGVATHYRVHISNLKLFNLVLGQVALCSSFRLASRQIACIREELSLGYLGGCNRSKVLLHSHWCCCVPSEVERDY